MTNTLTLIIRLGNLAQLLQIMWFTVREKEIISHRSIQSDP